jgi:Flp pilus assembly pilin Flp
MKRLVNGILRHRWGRKGQSTAEYIIIIALVAIGSIALITLFGNQIREIFRASSGQLAGNTSDQTQDMGGGAAATNKRINDF